jgi:hypothetical protein
MATQSGKIMSTSNNVVDLVWQGSTTIVIGVLNIREARNWEIFLRGLTCWYYGITGQWTAWTAPTLTSLHRILLTTLIIVRSHGEMQVLDVICCDCGCLAMREEKNKKALW